MSEAAARRCSACGEDKALEAFRAITTRHGRPGRHSLCRACEVQQRVDRRRTNGRPTHTAAVAIAERQRAAQRTGETYVPRSAKSAERRLARLVERRRREMLWLLKCVFEQRCVQGGEKPNTVRFRYRYRTSATFRESEIARRWATKERERARGIVSDGTLTPSVLRDLFAAASVCCYCTRPMASSEKTLDHVLPKSRGGRHSVRNVVVCCRSCNCTKKMRTPAEWAVDPAAPIGVRALVISNEYM